MDDARLTLEVIHSAAQAGAAVANHAPVTGFLENASGRVVGARFRDEDPGGSDRGAAGHRRRGGSRRGSVHGPAAGARGAGSSRRCAPPRGSTWCSAARPPAARPWSCRWAATCCTSWCPSAPATWPWAAPTPTTPWAATRPLDQVPTTEEEVDFTPGPTGEGAARGVRAATRSWPATPGCGRWCARRRAGRLLSESDTSRTHRIWQARGGCGRSPAASITTFRLMAEQLVDRVVGGPALPLPRCCGCAPARRPGGPTTAPRTWRARTGGVGGRLAGDGEPRAGPPVGPAAGLLPAPVPPPTAPPPPRSRR